MGVLKYWFLAERVPGVAPRFGAYLGVPVGIGLLLIASSPLLSSVEVRRKVLWVACAVMIGGSFVAVLRPSFIVPKWIKQLEQEHASIIPLLIEEGRKMGRLNWQARVWTQKGLEQWVEEVCRRHGLD